MLHQAENTYRDLDDGDDASGAVTPKEPLG